MMNKKIKEILKFLKKEKRASTSKIASYIGLPHKYAFKYLNSLRAEGFVIQEKETLAVYWKLK